MKRIVVIFLAVAIVAGIGWQVYRKIHLARGTSQKKAASAAVAVEVAEVRRATIHEIAKFTGTLAARSEFVVAPKVAGRLEKLLVDIGDRVENGQLVAVLDDEEYMQQVEQAKAELEVAKASVDEVLSQLEAAQRDFDRVEALRAKKIASESELDESRSQYRMALARQKLTLSQVAQKEAALQAAKVRLGYTKITASWTAGSDVRLVGERFANPGAMLAANDRIVSVVDIDELTGILYVTERDYAKVGVGQTVEISCDAYNKPFSGTVVRVAPLVKETSREARVEVQVLNGERLLRPGMFCRARLELAREHGTVVPRAALAMRDNRQGVFLADLAARTAKFVPVTVGVEEGLVVQVMEPALAGYVVTLGQHLLVDGTSITVPSMEEAATTRPAQAKRAPDEAEAAS
jgi:RND family efflux transporter MFP subunit